MGLLDSNSTKQLYNDLLGRDPDASGERFWMNDGGQAQTYEQTRTGIMNSDEYKTRQKNMPMIQTSQQQGAAVNVKAPSVSSNIQPLGLINSTPLPAVSSQGYTSSNADAVKSLTKGYTSTDVSVNPRSTVQGQLAEITASGSPLNQQAETAARSAMAKRGLLNSSIAVGAAQDAVIRQSLPIAQQDANTYYDADKANAAAKTSASAFEANAANTGSLQDANLQTSVNVSNAGAKNEAAKFGANAANTAAIATADNTLKMKMADIQANTSLSIAQKQMETQRAIADAQNATNVAISNGDNLTKIMLTNMDSASKLTQAEFDADTKFKLANMDRATKEALTKLDADNKQLLQSNSNAASAFQQYSTNLANISANDKLSGQAKEIAIQNQLNALRAGLDMISSTSNQNLSQYFERTEIAAEEYQNPNGNPKIVPPEDEE